MKKEVNIDRIYPNKKGKYYLEIGGIRFLFSKLEFAMAIAKFHYSIGGKNV